MNHSELGVIIQCDSCKAVNDEHPFRLTCVMCGEKLSGAITNGLKPMTDREELYKEIFSRTAIVAVSMTAIQRKEWREKLSLVAFEAKVTINAIDKADREERAEVQGESRNWLVSADYSPDVEASINTVKQRKERMSKMDKLSASLTEKLGISGDIAAEMLAPIERAATANGIRSIQTSEPGKKPRVKLITSELCRLTRHTECVGRFTDDKGSNACECDCHKRAAEINSKPFDINNPFGL